MIFVVSALLPVGVLLRVSCAMSLSVGSELSTDTSMLAGVGMTEYGVHPLCRDYYAGRGRQRSMEKWLSRWKTRTGRPAPVAFELEYRELVNLLDGKGQNRLDFNHLISHPPKVARLLRRFGTSECQRKRLFGAVADPAPRRASEDDADSVISGWFARLRESAKKQQKHKWLYRIASEIDWAVHNDRYMVYSTLTIDNRHYGEVFCKDSVALKNFFRRIERDCQRAYYGSVKAYERAKAAGTAIPDCELVSHVAIAERGSKTGRLHYHVLHTMKVLPAGTLDPNRRKCFGEPCINTELAGKWKTAIGAYWHYGKTACVPVRYSLGLSAGDKFTRDGWIWPVIKSTRKGKMIFVAKPAQEAFSIAGYLSKYITKSYEDDGMLRQGDFRCRVSCSKDFGLRQLRSIVRNASDTDLVGALCCVRKIPTDWVVGKVNVPARLLRRLSVREWLDRCISRGSRCSRVLRDVMDCPYKASMLDVMRQFIAATGTDGDLLEFMSYYKLVNGDDDAPVNEASMSRISEAFALYYERCMVPVTPVAGVCYDASVRGCSPVRRR